MTVGVTRGLTPWPRSVATLPSGQQAGAEKVYWKQAIYLIFLPALCNLGISEGILDM